MRGFVDLHNIAPHPATLVGLVRSALAKTSSAAVIGISSDGGGGGSDEWDQFLFKVVIVVL